MFIRLFVVMSAIILALICLKRGEFSDYERMADKITEETAQKLKRQKNLCLVGTGGRMMYDIQMMAMTFFYYQEVDFKEARELIIYSVKEYLSSINNNEKIRPYLHDNPFTVKNIKIIILFYKSDRTNPSPEKIGCVSFINGILEYYIRSDLKKVILEETYEEALQILSSETSNIIRS